MSATPRLASEFELVGDGEAACVRLSPEAMVAYRKIQEGNDKISVQRRTHLERYMAAFCQHEAYRRFLNEEKFKKEDDFPDGSGGYVSISAFKLWQWRLYGTIMQVEGKKCFVGVKVDEAKKQDKSNQNLMRRAAKEIAALREYGLRR